MLLAIPNNRPQTRHSLNTEGKKKTEVKRVRRTKRRTKMKRELNKTACTARNGKWSDEEHRLFLEAIERYGNLWKKVESHIKTRSCAQIRSHCQKYFQALRTKAIDDFKRTNQLKDKTFVIIREYHNYAKASLRFDENTTCNPESQGESSCSKAVSQSSSTSNEENKELPPNVNHGDSDIQEQEAFPYVSISPDINFKEADSDEIINFEHIIEDDKKHSEDIEESDEYTINKYKDVMEHAKEIKEQESYKMEEDIAGTEHNFQSIERLRYSDALEIELSNSSEEEKECKYTGEDAHCDQCVLFNISGDKHISYDYGDLCAEHDVPGSNGILTRVKYDA